MRPHDHPVLYSADLTGCGELHRFDVDGMVAAFAAGLRGAGATIVGESHHAFPGGGLTCVLILQESHAVLHTWPETGTVNIDIFSCSSRLRSLAAIDALGVLFAAAGVTVQEVPRADGHLPDALPPGA